MEQQARVEEDGSGQDRERQAARAQGNEHDIEEQQRTEQSEREAAKATGKRHKAGEEQQMEEDKEGSNTNPVQVTGTPCPPYPQTTGMEVEGGAGEGQTEAAGTEEAEKKDQDGQGTGAFSPSLTQEVREVRESGEKLLPASGGELLQNEMKKLMLHLHWDAADYVWQASSTFSQLRPGVALDWHHLLAMGKTQLQQTLATAQRKKNLLIVLEEQEIPLLRKLVPAVEEMDPDGIFLLILKQEDEPLFPAGPALAEKIPWTMGHIMRLSRPLHFEQGSKRPAGQEPSVQFQAPGGRPPAWAWACSGTAAQRSNMLQADYGVLKLSDPSEGLAKLTVALPPPPANMMAVQVATDVLPGLLEYLDRRGTAAHNIPGRAKGVTRTLFHDMNQEQLQAIASKWGDTPHFALMALGEYGGQDLANCHLVVEAFVRRSQKAKKAPYLWKTLDRILVQSGVGYALQYTAYNKTRIGIHTGTDALRFYEACVPEMQALGLLLKDERTQQFIIGDEVTETTATDTDSDGEAGVGRGLSQFCVVYDVPPWHSDQELLEALSQVAPGLTAATRLTWTPGSPVLAAWKIQGPGAAALEATLLEDAQSGTQMGVMSQRTYQADRRQRAEASARRQMEKSRQQGQNANTPAGVPLKRSYAAAASAKPRPRSTPTSLLGPQHWATK